MKENKNHVYKTYEKIADWMDSHRSRDLFERPYLDKVIAHLPPRAAILDLGCGFGEPIGQYLLDNGLQVTGVDAASNMLEIAKTRCPNIKFILSDMRNLNLGEKFACIIAWHSYFHLPPNDQRTMFNTFVAHLKSGGLLLFTTGPDAGEIWSDNGGENLYHASLAPDEYQKLLLYHGFTLLEHKIADPGCGNATVWLAKLKST